MKYPVSVLLALCFSAVAWGGAYDELTASEQAQIQQGQQVLHKRQVPGQSWPEVTVYQRADAGVDEAAAVFWDFPRYKEYFSDVMKKSSPRAARPQLNTVVVDFEIKVPVLPNDQYAMQNILAPIADGFQVSWKMLGESKYSKSAVGDARFEKLGTGTLIAYRNFVVLKPIANSFGDRAIQQALNTVASLVRNIHVIRTQKPALMQQQLQELNRSLGN